MPIKPLALAQTVCWLLATEPTDKLLILRSVGSVDSVANIFG
jgi:hypothetical protein